MLGVFPSLKVSIFFPSLVTDKLSGNQNSGNLSLQKNDTGGKDFLSISDKEIINGNEDRQEMSRQIMMVRYDKLIKWRKRSSLCLSGAMYIKLYYTKKLQKKKFYKNIYQHGKILMILEERRLQKWSYKPTCALKSYDMEKDQTGMWKMELFKSSYWSDRVVGKFYFS